MSNKADFIIPGQIGMPEITCELNSRRHYPKTNMELSESLNCREAALKIVESLIGTIERNAEGIRNDIGSEFIHDFRVSLRRLRTLLGQFKQVFPNGTADTIRNGLSHLGKISNKKSSIL